MKKTDSVRTPLALLHRIRKKFFGYNIFYDPCPFNLNFNPKTDKDALKSQWCGPVYLNPPYSCAYKFLKYANEQYIKHGFLIVCLVKLDILGTKTFKHISPNCSVYFLSKRIIFPGFTHVARFHSVLIVFGQDQGRFFTF